MTEHDTIEAINNAWYAGYNRAMKQHVTNLFRG